MVQQIFGSGAQVAETDVVAVRDSVNNYLHLAVLCFKHNRRSGMPGLQELAVHLALFNFGDGLQPRQDLFALVVFLDKLGAQREFHWDFVNVNQVKLGLAILG